MWAQEGQGVEWARQKAGIGIRCLRAPPVKERHLRAHPARHLRTGRPLLVPRWSSPSIVWEHNPTVARSSSVSRDIYSMDSHVKSLNFGKGAYFFKAMLGKESRSLGWFGLGWANFATFKEETAESRWAGAGGRLFLT